MSKSIQLVIYSAKDDYICPLKICQILVINLNWFKRYGVSDSGGFL